ncbi:caveolin-1-like [Crassostrea angulata]|uniref:caveolin-1-like n=1 Tax=Magallana angulata TaxID=2784310 RepID=UPI0022B0BF7C|nr:caveolin-1-like [Crassostrea angulata]
MEDDKVDLLHRDPNSINQHVQTNFEDVLAEPDGTRSSDCVWIYSASCFNGGKSCCYVFLSALCGIFLALFWGCGFAVISFEQIWCATPMYRCFSIYAIYVQKCVGTYLSCYLGPLCETCGLIFSRIHIDKSG